MANIKSLAVKAGLFAFAEYPMLRLTISTDLEAAKRYLRGLKADKVAPAAARAINKTLANVRTEATKEIRKERALKAGTIRDALAIERATKLKLSGSLTASGRPIPLRDYAARQGKRGVTVQVTPRGRTLVVHSGNKGFIIDRIGGHVFARVGKTRLPLKKLYGPSIPTAFLKQSVITAIQRVAGENWPKRFAEELRYELRG